MRRVIKRERVCEELEAHASGASSAGGGLRPGIRLVRVDGRVHSIELTCGCGRVSLLEIDYEDTKTPSETTS